MNIQLRAPVCVDDVLGHLKTTMYAREINLKCTNREFFSLSSALKLVSLDEVILIQEGGVKGGVPCSIAKDLVQALLNRLLTRLYAWTCDIGERNKEDSYKNIEYLWMSSTITSWQTRKALLLPRPHSGIEQPEPVAAR